MNQSTSELQQKYNNIISTSAIYSLIGIELDSAIIEDSYQQAQGNITMDEIRAKIIARIQANNI